MCRPAGLFLRDIYGSKISCCRKVTTEFFFPLFVGVHFLRVLRFIPGLVSITGEIFVCHEGVTGRQFGRQCFFI